MCSEGRTGAPVFAESSRGGYYAWYRSLGAWACCRPTNAWRSLHSGGRTGQATERGTKLSASRLRSVRQARTHRSCVTPAFKCSVGDGRLDGSLNTRLRRETSCDSVHSTSEVLKRGETVRMQAGGSNSELGRLRDAFGLLTNFEPERHDLVAGFVGAIGTKWDPILQLFKQSLDRFAYSSVTIRLSRLLETCIHHPWDDLPDRESRDYYTKRMDACDNLRRDTDNGSVMAALAICKIYEQRSSSGQNKPTAYMLRSLKHPDEVKLLRHVYGEAFFLVGVASSKASRRSELIKSLGSLDDRIVEAERLIVRDESDSHDKRYGQNVRDTYAMCDVFVPGSPVLNAESHVNRFVDSIFGEPFLTPTPNEEGMRFAHDASLRSSAPGRQVGAALVPRLGTPVVTGTNEVPKPGGGQYWVGDVPDNRDFKLGRDPNPDHIQRALEEIFERLRKHGWLAQHYEDVNISQLVELALHGGGSTASMLAGSRVVSLIEFAPCLHAEQATITNAVRSGVSTQDAVLYATTFPCHECAKMIIAAGLTAVHFIEPYPKSLVNELYSGMIDTDPPLSLSIGLGSGEEKIPFHQYVGIAPRWYSRAFTAQERKIGNELVTLDRPRATPRTHGWSESGVDQRQATTVEVVRRLTEELDRQK